MARTDYKSIDQYIAAQPEAVRSTLERVRGAIRRALPRAEEGISYQMPAFKLNGRVVLYVGGWKEHYALYPVTDPLVSAFKKELAPYELSHKGTIRFPLAKPVPVGLIARLAKFRAREVAEHADARVIAKSKSRPKSKVAGRKKR